MMLSLGEHKRADGIYVLTRTRLLDVYVWRFLFEPEQTRLQNSFVMLPFPLGLTN